MDETSEAPLTGVALVVISWVVIGEFMAKDSSSNQVTVGKCGGVSPRKI